MSALRTADNPLASSACRRVITLISPRPGPGDGVPLLLSGACPPERAHSSSPRTVENHLSRIYRKLDTPDRTGLAGGGD